MLKIIAAAALASLALCIIAAIITPHEAKSVEECISMIQPGMDWPKGC